MHGADAGGDSVARRRKVDFLALDQQAPLIGWMKAGHDLDERRLACAVLANQRMDFSGSDFQRDAVERDDAWKTLASIFNIEPHRSRAFRVKGTKPVETNRRQYQCAEQELD